MFLESLKLCGFRNLVDETVKVDSSVVVLSGDNGQGKTNFIESIYFLSVCKSFRAADTKELVRWGLEAASVFGRVRQERTKTINDIGVIIVPSGKKEVFVDGSKQSGFENYFGKFVCVSFSPTDLALVKGGPQLRRRFLDKHLVDLEPGLIRTLVNYQKALRNKAALLKSGSADPRLIDAWDRILAEGAASITKARVGFLSALENLANKYLSIIAPLDVPLTLCLKSDIELDNQVTASQYYSLFERRRAKEIQMRSCLVGPHRDDMLIAINGKDTRAFASQGQTRSVTLCLKLAVVELIESKLGESPVLLLDDVDSELDDKRIAALYGLVFKGERQVFITGTSLKSQLAPELKTAQHLIVNSGIISVQ